MSEQDTSERVYRIPIRLDPTDDSERPSADQDGNVLTGRADRSGNAAVGSAEEVPVVVHVRDADDSEGPVILSIGDDDDEEIDVELNDDSRSGGEDTVPRSRLLEMGRNSMRLEGEVRKLQTDLYQARAAATKAATEAENALKQTMEAQDAARRTQAEFQNFKRRIEREKADALKFKNAELFEDLLPVVDNLTLALSVPTGESDSELRKGVELTRKQFLDAVTKHELSRIDCVGKLFDPNFHEGVGRVASDQVPAEHVLTEVRAGYMYRDRLLRPAMVQVSIGTPGAAGSGQTGATDSSAVAPANESGSGQADESGAEPEG